MNRNRTGFAFFLGLLIAAMVGGFVLQNRYSGTISGDSSEGNSTIESAVTASPDPSGSADDGSQPLQNNKMASKDVSDTDDIALSTGESDLIASPEIQGPVGSSDPVGSEEEAEIGTTGDWQAPRFDILRVEKDGGTVIAGSGEPGALLEIMNGETVLGSVEIGPSGQFATELKDNLPSGDHQLFLRLSKDKGDRLVSGESAIISVPEDRSGEVLAMVAGRDGPSRILARPEPETTQSKTTYTSLRGMSGKVDESDSGAAAGVSGEQDKADTDNGPVETPPVAIEAVEIEGDQLYVAGSAPPGARLRFYANDGFVAEATGTSQGRFLVESEVALPVGPNRFRIDLMDGDGETVTARAEVPFDRPDSDRFAAVATPPTASNEKLDDTVQDGAVQTVDSSRESVEAASANGADVADIGKLPPMASSAERDSGQKDAQPSSDSVGQTGDLAEMGEKSLPDSPQAEPTSSGVPGENSTDTIAVGESPSAPQAGRDVFQADNQSASGLVAPKTDQTVVDSGQTEKSPPSPQAETGLSAQNAVNEDAVESQTAAGGQTQQSSLDADPGAPAQPSDPAIATNRTGSGAGMPTASNSDRQQSVEQDVAGLEIASGEQDPLGALSGNASPFSSTADPLVPISGNVIIRRRDTLWHISRRVYGQGIRYTTIYLANQDQIKNPDLIYPGQLFTLPEDDRN